MQNGHLTNYLCWIVNFSFDVLENFCSIQSCNNVDFLYALVYIFNSVLWNKFSIVFELGFFTSISSIFLAIVCNVESFYICFILADVMIVLWLWFFSPSKIVDRTLIFAYIIVILVVKGLVYIMLNKDGQSQAKLLNERLREYTKEDKNLL